jgi:hypothetical protein
LRPRTGPGTVAAPDLAQNHAEANCVFGQPVGRLDRRVIQEGEEFVAVVPQVLGKSLDEPWEPKDPRKTCATYYDEHLPESSVEILGHSVGGITYRHYAHRAPLAFKAIMTLPQPTAFSALIHGHDGECPCCRRPFADAA